MTTPKSLLATFAVFSLSFTLLSAQASPKKDEIILKNFTHPTSWVSKAKFDVPKDGFYRFFIEGGATRVSVKLDGDAFYHFDRGGAEKERDDKKRFIENVYLAKGEHEISIRAHASWMSWQSTKDTLKKLKIGFTPIALPAESRGRDSQKAAAPQRPATLTIREKDRENMVFEKDEPLTITIEQATTESARYKVEVYQQRGSKTPVWTKEIKLPANQTYASAEIDYPCDKEGAFEYIVKDQAGKVVAGPWAFVVVDSTPMTFPKVDKPAQEEKKILVDSVDCSKTEDDEHHFRDNGTSQVISSPAGSYRVTGPSYLHKIKGYVHDKGFDKKKHGPYRRAQEGEKIDTKMANFAACDWFAYSLRVKHPGKSHLLMITVPTDSRRVTALSAIDPVTTSRACAVLEVGNSPKSEGLITFAIPVWPNAKWIDVVIGNFGKGGPYSTQGAAAKMELYELPEGFKPMPEAANGWDPANEFGYYIEQRNLGIERFTMPKWWNDDDMVPRIQGKNELASGGAYDWKAMYDAWNRAAEYASHLGDNYINYGAHTYSMELFETDHKPRGSLTYASNARWKWRLVDRAYREPLPMILKIFNKHGVKIILDMLIQRITEKDVELIDPESNYPRESIMLTDPSGNKNTITPATYAGTMNPAHPLVRKYLVNFYEEIAKRFGKYDSFGGINIRQDAWGNAMCGWFFNDRTGYDDYTTSIFETETGVKMPEYSKDDKDRMKKRLKWLKENAWAKWLNWRQDKVESLMAEISSAVRKHAPHAKIYARGYPKCPEGSGFDKKRLEGNTALGCDKSEILGGDLHIEVNRLDPLCFKGLDISPSALDVPKVMNDEDTWINYIGSMVTGYGCSIRPYPYDLRKASDKLSEAPIDRVQYGGMWVLPVISKGRKQLAQSWRAIPKLDYKKVPQSQSPDGLVACWQAKKGKELTFYLINRTDVEQVVNVKLKGLTTKVEDLVSGKQVSDGNSFKAPIAPYMLRIFRATGANGIQSVTVVPNKTYLAELKTGMEQIEKIAKEAKDVVFDIPNQGGEFIIKNISKAEEKGLWQEKDLPVTAQELAQKLRKAWNEKHYFDVDRELENIFINQSWWFEAYGWPKGQYWYEQPQGEYCSPEKLKKALKGENAEIKDFFDAPGKMLVFPKGVATLQFNSPIPDSYNLVAWLMSGGDLGPIDVEVNGKKAGSLGVSGDTPYYAHFQTQKALSLPAGNVKLTLRNASGGPLVIQALELKKASPTAMKVWQALGLFEIKKEKVGNFVTSEGYGKAFPPEETPGTVKLSASYKGLDGKSIKWKSIDMGDDKFLQLLEKYFPYEYKNGNGVAYLATWIHSPEDRKADLYYSVDWFAKVWVNGKLVNGDINGPWGHFEKFPIELKKGWNMILVKTLTGSQSWKANFAISNPGDLKFSGKPPIKQ